jgi:hypothetical protein
LSEERSAGNCEDGVRERGFYLEGGRSYTDGLSESIGIVNGEISPG